MPSHSKLVEAGLSPPMRGNPYQRPVVMVGVTAGLSPPMRGNALDKLTLSRNIYPKGLSPPMRGNHVSRWRERLYVLKVYPRPCGETVRWQPSRMCNHEAVYPRPCGETSIMSTFGGLAVGVGSIPAHAGKPTTTRRQRTVPDYGLSPPMRGNRFPRAPCRIRLVGSIPAHAGKPRPPVPISIEHRPVYPRPCGETSWSDC